MSTNRDSIAIGPDEARAFELLISQQYEEFPAENWAIGFVEVSGPANFKKRWQYQLGGATAYEDNPLRQFQGLTFKIVEIRINNSDYLNKVLQSLMAFNIQFLAKVVDRQAYPPR